MHACMHTYIHTPRTYIRTHTRTLWLCRSSTYINAHTRTTHTGSAEAAAQEAASLKSLDDLKYSHLRFKVHFLAVCVRLCVCVFYL